MNNSYIQVVSISITMCIIFVAINIRENKLSLNYTNSLTLN